MGNDERPNILLMNCHDLGKFLGCYGMSTVQSPYLDKLADEGIKFDNAFCTAPQCSPSRASLFTGRYPQSNGVLGLTHGDFSWDLYPEEKHLGERLKELGYDTSIMGVHHESINKGDLTEIATRCGFDEIMPQNDAKTISDDVEKKLALFSRRKQPFYLQIGFHEPHRIGGTNEYMGFLDENIQPDNRKGVTVPEYLQNTASAREEMAELQGSVNYMDQAVGHILDSLKEYELEENTMIIFTTDHGLALPRAKCSLYDPGLETALIFRYPRGDWKTGLSYKELISNIDVLPTILEMLGEPIDDTIEGQSFLPLIQDNEYDAREEIYGEMTYHDYYDPCRCVRTDEYKLIVNFSNSPSFMDPSQSWRPRCQTRVPENPKLAYHPPVELYDLTKDPFESMNIAEDHKYEEVKQKMLKKLHSWMRDTKDPLLKGAVTSPMHRRVQGILENSS